MHHDSLWQRSLVSILPITQHNMKYDINKYECHDVGSLSSSSLPPSKTTKKMTTETIKMTRETRKMTRETQFSYNSIPSLSIYLSFCLSLYPSLSVCLSDCLSVLLPISFHYFGCTQFIYLPVHVWSKILFIF